MESILTLKEGQKWEKIISFAMSVYYGDSWNTYDDTGKS